jgi:hypothetical protein
MRTFTCALLALIVGMASVKAVDADTVVIDNGEPDYESSVASDTDFPLQQSGDFVLPSGANSVTGIRFWGTYGFTGTPPDNDNFKIRFFTDEGGKPANDWFAETPVGAVDRTSLGPSPIIPAIAYYLYEAKFSVVALDPNKTYWLSVLNNTSHDPNDNWYWARSETTGNSKNRTGDGLMWGDPRVLPFNTFDHYELAFQLIGVPEPACLPLLLIGATFLASGRATRFRMSLR